MQQIAYTTTAVCRPDLFRTTLESFQRNLTNNKMRESVLYINVDPLPSCGIPSDVGRVAAEFFGYVVINTPDRPNFPAAVKWCWSQPSTEFFFHLEDDWELVTPFDLHGLITLLQTQVHLTAVNLRAYDGHHMANGRICLCPGLFRTADAKVIAGRLSVTANPEKQLRLPHEAVNPEGGKQGGYLGTQLPDHRVLRDIGRPWMQRMGLSKVGDQHFTTWKEGVR